MLDIQDLSISFHKQPVLQHLSFHLDGHECIYIHGINGSGKSTLFKLICDIIKPTSGIITKKNDLQIGALIENPGFLENETLAYNLQFLASLKNQYDSTYIESLCQQFQLDLHSSMKVKNFSVGILGIRLLGDTVTDYLVGEAFTMFARDVNIYVSSWGPLDDGRTLRTPGQYMDTALKKAWEYVSLY